MFKYISITFFTLLLLGCGGGSSGSSTSNSGSTGTTTVNCANGALCPPAQVNIVQPKTNN